jgi:hypothetical protein
MDTKLHA